MKAHMYTLTDTEKSKTVIDVRNIFAVNKYGETDLIISFKQYQGCNWELGYPTERRDKIFNDIVTIMNDLV